MRLAVLGRSEILLGAAKRLADAGHEIVLVGTCRSEAYYKANEADFESFAAKCGADFFLDHRINSADIVARLKKSGAELGVSWNWMVRIEAEAISAFRHGILNVHAGDLPRFRGNACPNWAILLNEPHIGLCVHRMVPEAIDSGDVLKRKRLPLHSQTYIGDVYGWLEEAVPDLLVEAASDIASGRASWEVQSEVPGESLRCYPRRPEDSCIDWQKPADEIVRLVRASSRPFAGAYTTLEGDKRVTIWRADQAIAPSPYVAMPGQVLYSDCGNPVVAAGEGAVRLIEIEIDGIGSGDTAKVGVLKSLRNRLI